MHGVERGTDAPVPGHGVRARAVRGAGRPHARRHRARASAAAALTYRELDERANRVAARPARRSASAPTSMVGVFVERSIEMVVGLLGDPKAGGAYVPLDPGLPARAHRDDARGLARRRGAHALDGCADSLPATSAARRRARRVRRAHGGRAAPVDRASTAHNLAYVIFTSGSTGRPKGVMIEHRNVVELLRRHGRAARHRAAARPASGWPSPASRSTSRCSSCSGRWRAASRSSSRRSESRRRRRRRSRGAPRRRPMDFSLFYFAADAGERTRRQRYRLLLEGAKFADTPRLRGGVDARAPLPRVRRPVPEPVGDERGGRRGHRAHRDPRRQRRAAAAQPDPRRRGVVGRRQPLATAASACRSRRAGTPTTSRSRPENFERPPRADGRGHRDDARAVARRVGAGDAAATAARSRCAMFPPPVQREPPIWITAGGSPDTFAMAGQHGRQHPDQPARCMKPGRPRRQHRRLPRRPAATPATRATGT